MIGTGTSQPALSQQSTPSSQGAMPPSIHQPAWASQTKAELPSGATPLTTDESSSTLVDTARARKFNNFFTPNRDSPSMAGFATQVFTQNSRTEPVPARRSQIIRDCNSGGLSAVSRSVQVGRVHRIEVDCRETVFARPGIPERNQIPILYPGGSIRTSKGTIVGSRIGPGTTPLDIEKKYLLFLAYDKSTDSFDILRAWIAQARNRYSSTRMGFLPH